MSGVERADMDRHSFIATGPVPAFVEDRLKCFGSVHVADKVDPDSLAKLMDQALGLIVRGTVPVPAEVIEAGKSLKVIGRSGVGYDNVDITAATRCGIPVVYTPGASSTAVAEGAFAMILSLAKRLPELDRATKAGNWNMRNSLRIGDLEGATLGIVGFGNIGQKLAMLAHPFGMRIVVCDPVITPSRAQEAGVELLDLEPLLSCSDYISLHAPLTEETEGFLDRERMKNVKSGAVIVNLARGGLFESLDVIFESLTSGHISGLGLTSFHRNLPMCPTRYSRTREFFVLRMPLVSRSGQHTTSLR